MSLFHSPPTPRPLTPSRHHSSSSWEIVSRPTPGLPGARLSPRGFDTLVSVVPYSRRSSCVVIGEVIPNLSERTHCRPFRPGLKSGHLETRRNLSLFAQHIFCTSTFTPFQPHFPTGQPQRFCRDEDTQRTYEQFVPICTCNSPKCQPDLTPDPCPS